MLLYSGRTLIEEMGLEWYTLVSKHPPQPFSLTFKGTQDHKVKVKTKKNVLAMKAAAEE